MNSTTKKKRAPRRRTVEHYVAVRIGKPGNAYFMLGDDRLTPALFISAEKAREAIERYRPECPTIRRVTVSD